MLDKHGTVKGGFPTEKELNVTDCDPRGNLKDWLDSFKMSASNSRSSLLVAGGQSSASRSRHALLLYLQLQQRVQSKLIKLAHIGDKDMPVDCFTKWVSKAKVEASLAYLSNSRARTAVDAAHDLKVALAILGCDDG